MVKNTIVQGTPEHKEVDNPVGNKNQESSQAMTEAEETLLADLLAKKKAQAEAVNNAKAKCFADVMSAGKDYQQDSQLLISQAFSSLPEGSTIDSRHKVVDGNVLSWHYVSITGQSTGVGIFTSGKVESVISGNRQRLESPLKGKQGRKSQA